MQILQGIALFSEEKKFKTHLEKNYTAAGRNKFQVWLPLVWFPNPLPAASGLGNQTRLPQSFSQLGFNKKSQLLMFRPQPRDCKGSLRDQTNRLDDPPSFGTSFAQHCPTFISGAFIWSLKKKTFSSRQDTGMDQLKMAIILPTGQWYAPSAVINDAWYCMVLPGIALYRIVLHGIAWYCMVLHGIAWYCMVLHCIAWYCRVLHGIAWYCMVLHGIAWYCMILQGIAWYYTILHGIAC